MAYRVSAESLEQALGERLVSVAQAAAISLRPADVVFVAPGDEESRTYKRMQASLIALRDATKSERLVLFDSKQRALCDSENLYPIGARVPDLARDSMEVGEVLGGRARASAVLFEGSDGRRYKSGYAPVMDENKAIAGIVVDGRAGFFDALDTLGAQVIGVGLLGLLCVAVLSLLLSNLLARPIDRLVLAAARIGDGDLVTPIDSSSRVEEVRWLAGALEQMRVELAGRERELQLMLGGIAHEVRNPLGGIELFSGLLAEELQEQQNEAQLGYVKRIQKELTHLARLVDEFLDYARERQLERSEVELGELFFEIQQIVSAASCEGQITIKVELGEDTTILADASMLRRAMLNLLQNAVQASPPKGTITLGALQEAGELILFVEDEGPGVPLDQWDRIFEPFFTTKEKGSGLGLALVAKTAKIHGGTVRVAEASHGKSGARILLRLPTA